MICDKKADFLPGIIDIREKKEDVCPVDWALNVADAARKESCGLCVMCREGLLQLYTIISDITQDRGESEDIELLTDLCEVINKTGGCEISRTASELILESLKLHTDEWNVHLRRKRCSASVCRQFITVVIQPELCQGCGDCVEKCPEDAILGGKDMIHVISREKCTKCGECIAACPHQAIIKAGAVIPKTPEQPVPVGSFGGDDDGGRRRRRRG